MHMDAEAARHVMQLRIRRLFGTQKAFAQFVGISESQVSQALSGACNPPPLMLDALGLKRVVTYQVREL